MFYMNNPSYDFSKDWIDEEFQVPSEVPDKALIEEVARFNYLLANYDEWIITIVSGGHLQRWLGKVEDQSFNPNRIRALGRDGQCLRCGSIIDKTVHHIIPQSEEVLNYYINLVTLCIDCHASLHKDEHIQDKGVLFATRYKFFKYTLKELYCYLSNLRNYR